MIFGDMAVFDMGWALNQRWTATLGSGDIDSIWGDDGDDFIFGQRGADVISCVLPLLLCLICNEICWQWRFGRR